MKRVIFTVGLAVMVSACAAPKEPPKLGIVPEEEKAQAEKPAPMAEKAKTEWENLSEELSEYVALAKECDERFFARVEPEKIDRWELPIDVPKMEDKCDDLIFRLDEILKKPAFYRNPDLDAMMRATARVADEYMILALRCKKVGVKDKLPYIKLVTRLRDELRADVTALGVAWDKTKVLKDENMAAYDKMSADEIVKTAHALLLGKHKAFADFIVKQRESEWPTWRYCLWVEKSIVAGSMKALNSAQSGVSEKYAEAANTFSTALDGAFDYFTGDYFETEEEQGPVIYKGISKVFKTFSKAAKKAKIQ